MLQVGDKMPSFAAADETGKMVTDKDLIGKKTVIYFYPKDSTPGCTAEACNIRDNYHAFLAQGYQVYGVSKDSEASHVKFKEKYALPFPLLSDPTTEMLQAFGAWGEKKELRQGVDGNIKKNLRFQCRRRLRTYHRKSRYKESRCADPVILRSVTYFL